MSRASWWAAAAWAAAILIGTSIPGAELPRVPTGADKVAHFALYAPLGVLVGRALRAAGMLSWRTVAVSLLAMALFAAGDELHQDLVPGRSADPVDWLADLVGATAGLLLLVTPTLRSEQRI